VQSGVEMSQETVRDEIAKFAKQLKPESKFYGDIINCIDSEKLRFDSCLKEGSNVPSYIRDIAGCNTVEDYGNLTIFNH
jgi:hypothetical protein